MMSSLNESSDSTVECILKMSKRIQELEDVLNHIYLNTYRIEKSNHKDRFFFWSINQSIRPVLKEYDRAFIEGSID